MANPHGLTMDGNSWQELADEMEQEYQNKDELADIMSNTNLRQRKPCTARLVRNTFGTKELSNALGINEDVISRQTAAPLRLDRQRPISRSKEVHEKGVPECSKPSNSVRASAPSSDNPFYSPDWTLQDATIHILRIFRGSIEQCQQWAISIDVHQLQQMIKASNVKNTRIRQMCRGLGNILEFLTNGRVGWDLTWICDEFFRDISPLLKDLGQRLFDYSENDGCKWLYENGVAPILEIRDRLGKLKIRREGIRRSQQASV